MKLALFSISYAGLWGQDSLSLSDFITKAASLVYDGVMLAGKRPHLSLLDWDVERCAQLRATLKAQNLECLVLGAYTDFSPDASELPATELQIYHHDQRRLRPLSPVPLSARTGQLHAKRDRHGAGRSVR